MGKWSRGAATRGIVGGILVAAVALVALMAWPWQAAWAGVEGGVLSETAALSPIVNTADASEEWWALVQAQIQEDMAPFKVDGLSQDPDWSFAGELANDQFGWSVASAGDVNGDGYADVIVGAPGIYGVGKKGKAYVFFGSATGPETSPGWSQTGENDDDNFGFSVAGAGDVNGDGYADVVVGAYTHDSIGRAYVFLGSAAGLSLNPLPPLGGDAGSDSFGYSVAGAGDVNGDGYADILIGDRGFNSATGRVLIYHGGASGPDATADRILIGEQYQDWFGGSVAAAGDVNGDGYADIIVGAVGYDEGVVTQTGAAYVFHGSASGIGTAWDWKKADQTQDDWFGSSVAGAGDVNGDGYADVIIGAKYWGDLLEPGAVFVYHGSASGLTTGSWNWRATGENDGDHFGCSVAGAGDVNGDGYADVILGADAHDSETGRAYLYKGSADGLPQTPSWSDEGEFAGSRFGGSVAGAGDVNGDGYADVVVGAPDLASLQGKAYAYHGMGDEPSTVDAWGEEGSNTGDVFGFSVAGAGDVNGDGYSDVIVGAQGVNVGRGRVYVYHGSLAGLPAFPNWSADGDQANAFFGGSVAGAGDVNGDGYADVIVGARVYDSNVTDVGRAYVYYGGADGLGTEPGWFGTGEAADDHYGISVAGAGDVNGDGYGDVIVGADGNTVNTGKVYIYHGSAGGLGTNADRQLTGAAHYEYFGHSVAGAGDVNGDGYADVVVGAYGAPGGEYGGTFKGAAQVFLGSATGVGSASAWSLSGENDGDYFGYSVAGAGDVNGDAYSDILVGAYQFGSGRGKIYLYDSTESGIAASPTWSTIPVLDQPDFFGFSVAGAGDVNGDGLADLLVGARNAFDGSQKGYAALYFGPKAGGSTLADWGTIGENDYDLYGVSVAGAGDVNGDGYSDLLVGASAYDGGRGKVYAYLGNGGGGRQVLGRQIAGDDGNSPVQPWGLGYVDGFDLWMWATDPMGRGRVKLQVEGCPPGVDFGVASSCITVESETWQDAWATTTGRPRRITMNVAGFPPSTLYHWRARVLYAPYMVLRTGITPPPNPAHGPWRRFQAQAFEADIRTAPALPNDRSTVFLPVVLRNR